MRKLLLSATAVTGVAVAVALTLPSEQAHKSEPARPEFSVKTGCGRGPKLICDVLDTTAKKGERYRRAETGSTECVTYKVWNDGGTEVTGHSNHPGNIHTGLETVPGSCVLSDSVKGERIPDGGVVFVAQDCACSTGKGECRYLEDGGWSKSPKGKTLGPGYPPFENWAGGGCQPKACTELMGQSSWPTNCPR